MTTVSDNQKSSSDEEPDYMSEEFLNQCTSNDVRPSLVHSRVEKRKLDVYRRQLAVNKTKAEKEKEQQRSLEDALKVPISSDNKGFKMLEKMGYKPGSSIGRDRNDPCPSRRGITAPIEIELKKGRAGLDRKSRQTSQIITHIGRDKHEFEQHQKTFGDPEEYRLRRQNAALAKEVYLDLKKAQFACQTLDEESGQREPKDSWYWPKVSVKKDTQLDSDSEDDVNAPMSVKKPRLDEEEEESSSSEEDEEIIPDEDKLKIIADYLRCQYFYCLWCATKFENETDMQSSCPGLTKDDH